MANSGALRRRHLLDAARAVEAVKLAYGCVDCGYREHPQALHFDHRDPRTKRPELGWFDDRSKLVTGNRLRRFLEHVARYCDVRCANCHAIRSAAEEHWRSPYRTPPDPEPAPPTLF